MPRCSSARAVSLASVASPARPLTWCGSLSPAPSSMSPPPLRITVSAPLACCTNNVCVVNVSPMSSTEAAASAVSVLSVDAGSRGVDSPCAATTVPFGSITAAEMSLPTPGARRSASTSAAARLASTVRVRSAAGVIVPPSSTVALVRTSDCATSRKVSGPGITSVRSPATAPAARASETSAASATVRARRARARFHWRRSSSVNCSTARPSFHTSVCQAQACAPRPVYCCNAAKESSVWTTLSMRVRNSLAPSHVPRHRKTTPLASATGMIHG